MEDKTKQYPCLECDKSFAKIGFLNQHVNEVHLKLGPFTWHCPLCDHQFLRKNSLKLHTQVVWKKF